MNVRFLLGPAGSGKTFRCLEEIRARLTADPLGPPLILLAPRQATYQLELQLLSGSGLAGYTRLQIVPFERFAAWLLEQLESPPRALLSEEGRVMVLRALLHQHHGDLTVFGTSSRAAGFARLLSRQLHELQQHRTTPEALRRAAEQIGGAGPLRDKLHDLAFLLERYRDWLARQNSPDAGTLIEQAIERLEDEARRDRSTLRLDGLWLDGAAELTPQELDLLAAIVPFCDEATLAFCLESEPVEDPSWLSTWAVIAQTYRRSRARLAAVEGCKISVEILGRGPHTTRFSCGRLPGVAAGAPRGRQGELFAGPEESLKAATEAASSLIGLLEANWTRPAATAVAVAGSGIALVRCDEPEQEAVAAAREILRFVHAGHRFRECAVLVRNLDTHHAGLRRVFTRYGIPFFLDRRESVAHHPLAQLTRGALHTVQFHWRLTDWFSALKSGLTSLTENEVDLLENAAIANGWEGGAWSRPLELADNPGLGRDCERCRERVMPAFLKLRDAIAGTPTGGQLAAAIRRLWEDLGVPDRMQEWTTAADARGEASGSAHQTVLEELTGWLEDLELAFREVALPLRDWLPILEAGLGS
ncbi:MAG TPA: hypothetical protein DCY13_21405, partial [Verrucomicrobiales bacterium]|nr:hypothetical protein [Verrucomicrobiales bacterium]